MDKLRLVYTQTGRARWISHLDAMRTLQRGLLRAGVPLRYSEGFNPHALISIVMPLSVGTESMCQMADIRVREDVDLSSLPARLTAVMPEGLRFTGAYEDFDKPAELKWLDTEGLWEYDDADPGETASRCRGLFSGSVIVTRRTKRGEGPFPVTEHIRDLTFIPEGKAVRVRVRVSASEPVVNPDLITAAVKQNAPELAPDSARFIRLALFKADGKPFR
ncbi:MAG: DUF2344 domain-containing protein [Oscillospiraceae bacterium]|nr:DUF2344 domain-containing protein [Oscillospiraceae bacterium]